MMQKYILKGHEVIPCDNWAELELFYRSDHRRVAFTHLSDGTDVSTVFLGFNHSWVEGELHLFETMVFTDDEKNKWNQYLERCATWDEAELQHKHVVRTCQVWQAYNRSDRIFSVTKNFSS